MKKLTTYFLLLALFLGTLSSKAQRNKRAQNLIQYDYKRLHFGFTLGINDLNFNMQKNSNTITNDTLKTLNSKSQKGFNLGIVSNLRIGKYTDLRFVPTLVFGERNIDIPVKRPSIGPDVVDIGKLYNEADIFTFDPGFTSTASCVSQITFIDGEKG